MNYDKSASQWPTQKSYKKHLEFKNNAVSHMTFWSGWHVGQDPNKSLTLTNTNLCIENMFTIIHTSII